MDGLSLSKSISNPPGLEWWWVVYTRDLLQEVEARPRASTVLDDRLSDIAIKEAMKCPTCRKHVHRAMLTFKRLFAKEIEETISTVCYLMSINYFKCSNNKDIPNHRSYLTLIFQVLKSCKWVRAGEIQVEQLVPIKLVL
jgi:hypothetical protein